VQKSHLQHYEIQKMNVSKQLRKEYGTDFISKCATFGGSMIPVT